MLSVQPAHGLTSTLTFASPDQTQAIDDTYRSVSQCSDPVRAEEGKQIVAELGNLKYEVQHDRQLTYVLF